MKKKKEAKTVSKGSHKGQKRKRTGESEGTEQASTPKKRTHETSSDTSDSEREGAERASTPKKKPKKKRTCETSSDTSDSEHEGAEQASTPKKKPKKKRTCETSSDTSDSESEGAERASTPKKKSKKKRTHETSSDTSDSESEGAEQTSKSQKRSKKTTPEITQASTSKHKPKRKHYKRRTCTICHKSVTIIRRHIIEVHVNKHEKIPLARAEAMIQMAYHGNKTWGPKRKEGKGKGRKTFHGRPKEICPLCDRVQLFLTTHLQRYHKLARDSSEYQRNMRDLAKNLPMIANFLPKERNVELLLVNQMLRIIYHQGKK